ncbi:hypothetical protein BGX34_001447 [Mortierella sp. NVP85]|nr:hypothetical protein BGX34_001447 [Mortierella sp. NVP85]
MAFLHCEVKSSGSSKERVTWDLLRLARFYRTSIVYGQRSPLLQIIGRKATYMRNEFEDGLFILRKIGTFKLPFVRAHMGKLAKKCGVLIQAKKDVEPIARIRLKPMQNIRDIVFVLGRLGNFLAHEINEESDLEKKYRPGVDCGPDEAAIG